MGICKLPYAAQGQESMPVASNQQEAETCQQPCEWLGLDPPQSSLEKTAAPADLLTVALSHT